MRKFQVTGTITMVDGKQIVDPIIGWKDSHINEDGTIDLVVNYFTSPTSNAAISSSYNFTATEIDNALTYPRTQNNITEHQAQISQDGVDLMLSLADHENGVEL